MLYTTLQGYNLHALSSVTAFLATSPEVFAEPVCGLRSQADVTITHKVSDASAAVNVLAPSPWMHASIIRCVRQRHAALHDTSDLACTGVLRR